MADQYPPNYQGGQLPDHPRAQTVFIMSIIGIVVWILSPIAWYMGAQAKTEVQANPGRWNAGGQLYTGTMIAKIFTILGLVGFVLYILFFIFVGCAAATSGSY